MRQSGPLANLWISSLGRGPFSQITKDHSIHIGGEKKDGYGKTEGKKFSSK